MDALRRLKAEGMAVASSKLADPRAAVAEIIGSIGDHDLAGGLLFCADRYDREALAPIIQESFCDYPVIGCISAGEVTEQGYDTDCLLFIGFPADSFAMSTLLFTDLEGFDRDDARRRIRHLAANARQEGQVLGDCLKQVALFFVDGLSHREEVLTMTAQDALGDIALIGGSSGDGLTFADTGVLYGGEFRKNAAVFAILTSSRPLHVFSANHYEPGAARMVVTAADPEKRIVHEINAMPAAEEYRRLAGNMIDPLDTTFFAAHPPMVRTGGTYHVRSIQSANDDGSLTFYCAVDNGIVLTIGEPIDRIAGMKKLFEEIEREVGSTDMILAFDCVLNRIDSESRQMGREISALYAQHRVFGFNTYGEQFRAAHMNQTLSGLAIGR